MTRVIYLEDPDHALPVAEKPDEQTYFEVPPGDNPLDVADRLGRPMAILRMGGRVPDADGPDAHVFVRLAPLAASFRWWPSSVQLVPPPSRAGRFEPARRGTTPRLPSDSKSHQITTTRQPMPIEPVDIQPPTALVGNGLRNATSRARLQCRRRVVPQAPCRHLLGRARVPREPPGGDSSMTLIALLVSMDSATPTKCRRRSRADEPTDEPAASRRARRPPSPKPTPESPLLLAAASRRIGRPMPPSKPPAVRLGQSVADCASAMRRADSAGNRHALEAARNRRTLAGRRISVGRRRKVSGAWSTRIWKSRAWRLEDTVVHYDTIDGRTVVEPSNRVVIYSPRFGAVRQVTAALASHRSKDWSWPQAGRTDPILRKIRLPAPPCSRCSRSARSAPSWSASKTATRLPIANRPAACGRRTWPDHLLPFEDFEIVRTGMFCTVGTSRGARARRRRPSPGRTIRPCK